MKKLTLTLSVLALLGAAAAGFFWWQIGNTKKELQDRLSTETTRADGLQRNLSASREENETLTAGKTALEGELADTKSELNTATSRAMQLNATVEQLRADVAAKTQSEQELTARITQLRNELTQLRLAAGGSLSAEQLAGMEDRLKGIEGGTTGLGVAPVGYQTSVAKVGAFGAFVVLDFGSAQGSRIGQLFNITRGGAVIADATVSDTRPDYTIAQVNPDTLRSAPREGDAAVLVK